MLFGWGQSHALDMVEFVRQSFYRCVLPFLLIGGGIFFRGTYKLTPFVRFSGALLRPSFLSLVYVFLGFLGPAFPSIKSNALLPSATKFYLIFCSLVSLVATILQLVYQSLEYFNHTSTRQYVEQCENSLLTHWLIQCGFIRLPQMTMEADGVFDSLRIVGPEIVALLASVVTLVVCSTPKCDAPAAGDDVVRSEPGVSSSSNDRNVVPHYVPLSSSPNFSLALVSTMRRLSDVLLTFFVALVGFIHPSLLNLVYFGVFLMLMTWWALYTPLRRQTFNAVKRFLIIYLALHFSIIFAYQIPVCQQIVSPDSFVARLVGLTALVRTDCKTWWTLRLPDYYSWTGYVNLAAVFIGFHLLLVQYAWTKNGVGVKSHGTAVGGETDGDDASSVHEELLSGVGGDDLMGELLFPMQRITSEVLDRQKISDIFREERGSGVAGNLGQRAKHSFTVKGLQSFLYFCLYHCYVFALLAMLTWALLYHSLFGLSLLILSCFLWALHDSRKWTFKFSPVILAYAEFLLLAQYVYNMDLTDVLPNESYIRIIGFILPPNQTQAIVTLGIKTLLSLPLFVLLRLSLREEFYNSLTDHDRLKRLTYGTFDSSAAYRSASRSPQTNVVSDGVTDSGAFEFISDFFIKYWIFVVAILLLVNGVASPPVLYSLGFFVFFTVLVFNLHVSFSFFRKTTYLFLTFLIIYSSLVLIAVYSYQFSSVPELFHNITGLNKNWTEDIGLVYFDDLGNDANSLFIRLILPISLIVVIMLQLKFFHDPWSKLIQMPARRTPETAVESTATVIGNELGGDSVDNVLQSVRRGAATVSDAVWRLLEVHGYRIILFVMVLIAVKHFCVLNFVVIIFVALALCFSSLMPLVSLLLCIYMSAVFIARRIYELNLIEPLVNVTKPTDFTCPNFNVNDTEKEFRYMTSWIGFESADSVTWDLNGLVLVIVLIGLQLCIRYRQRHHRLFLGVSEPPAGIIFSEVKPSTFDRSLTDGLKCFLNYGFYKFGLEISLGMMAAVAWIRMDLLGTIQVLWALAFVKLPRSSCKRLWPIFVMYVAITFVLQYAMAIGIPVEWCIDYPWSSLLKSQLLNDNLLLFLDLANNRMVADRFYACVIVDFFLLMIVSAQMLVFWQENDAHPAGSNSSIYKKGEYVLYKENPYYDFIVEQRSFVDFIKFVVFNYGHWITLVAVLAAGLGGTSIFAMGYLILAFWMLWQGSNLYTMTKFALTIKKWKYLAYYTIIVMFFKVVFQVFGCSLAHLTKDIGIGTFDLCTIEQVFSVVCVNKFAIDNVDTVNRERNSLKCDAYVMETINRETKIGFDMIAFIFILFQLRILNSWFFQRCMIEFRCEMIQAKRGAVLINQLIEKEMREQKEQQNSKFKEIKNRTAEIRKRYEALQRRGSTVAFTPQTYGQAKRAGDYYMFEYDPNIDKLVEPIQSFVPEVTPGAGEFDKLDPAQLLHAAIQRDLDLTQTLSAVESAEKIKDEELRMIAAVAKTQKEREQAMQILLQRQKRKLDEITEAKSSPAAYFREMNERADKEEKDGGEDASGSVETRHSYVDDGESGGGQVVKFRRRSSDRNSADGPNQSGDEEQAEPAKSWGETIISVVQFVWKMFLAVLGWAAAFLNRRSREHRYVSYVLNKEKERLKVIMNDELYDERKSARDLRRHWESINVYLVTSEADIRRLEDEAHTRWEERNVFARLMTALGNCFSAHTDVLCFFMAAVAHAMCSGLVTLPLPLIVFFWGALANPRPSKMFWVCMIAYTEFVIGTKFVFQFLFWPWNQPSATVKSVASAYPLNYVFGVQKVDCFAVYDVALLILLFFHRYMMRRLGLWKDANVQDTFSSSPQIESSERQRASPQETSTRTTSLDPIEKEHVESSAAAVEKSDEELAEMESGLRKRMSDAKMRPSTSSDRNNSPFEQLEMTVAKADGDGERRSYSADDDETKKHGALYVFVYQLLYPKFRYIRDLYPLMFFLDMLCFMIVVFGYSSFGEGGSGDVINDIRANRVPLTFVVMLIIISLMIVIDRGLYLRKAVIWKLAYQILIIVGLHVWIFGILPSFTQEPAYKNRIPLYLYIIKCVYFLISAWQIRNGYPPLCIGNLLTHSYGLINMILFKIFMIVPFLFELRTAIDWTWTDTSMPLFDFFNMENFYGVIYNLKCARTFEQSFPAPRGEPKGKVVKYLMGLPMILVLILVIWCPLLVFSMLNHVGMVANPDFVKLSVSIEGYPPIYSMEAQGIDVEEARQSTITDLTNRIASNDAIAHFGVDASRQAISFIKEYQDQGILNVNFRPESEVMWQISKESLEALKSQLLINQTLTGGHKTMKIKIHLEFQRPRLDKTKEPTIHSNVIQVDLSNDTRVALSEVIDGKRDEVKIPYALPMSVVVPNEGEVTAAEAVQRLAFYNVSDDAAPKAIRLSYNNLRLRLVSGSADGEPSYWLAQLDIEKHIAERGFHFHERNITYGTDRSLKYVQLVAFVDRVFPTYLTSLVQGGIIAMYVAVVLLVGRIIRGLITSNPLDVIISEIPNPDYLLKICLDIYLVREARDFVLEQDLFAKLIFLFRSPATLIKWTRYKLKPE